MSNLIFADKDFFLLYLDDVLLHFLFNQDVELKHWKKFSVVSGTIFLYITTRYKRREYQYHIIDPQLGMFFVPGIFYKGLFGTWEKFCVLAIFFELIPVKLLFLCVCWLRQTQEVTYYGKFFQAFSVRACLECGNFRACLEYRKFSLFPLFSLI